LSEEPEPIHYYVNDDSLRALLVSSICLGGQTASSNRPSILAPLGRTPVETLHRNHTHLSTVVRAHYPSVVIFGIYLDDFASGDGQLIWQRWNKRRYHLCNLRYSGRGWKIWVLGNRRSLPHRAGSQVIINSGCRWRARRYRGRHIGNPVVIEIPLRLRCLTIRGGRPAVRC